MKKAETTIDFVDDTVNILGETIDLEFTSSGHYMIPISKPLISPSVFQTETSHDHTELENDIVFWGANLSSQSYLGKKKIAIKFHRQFGHPRHEKLLKLMEDARVDDQQLLELVKQIENECEICQRHKKSNLESVVGFSLAKGFNQTVAVDLKTFKDVKILHLIDLATRYSVGVVIESKHKKVIVDKIFRHWTAIFGPPEQFLSALEGTSSSELIAKHLNIMHAARKAFIESGASEKLRHALKHKVR